MQTILQRNIGTIYNNLDKVSSWVYRDYTDQTEKEEWIEIHELIDLFRDNMKAIGFINGFSQMEIILSGNECSIAPKGTQQLDTGKSASHIIRSASQFGGLSNGKLIDIVIHADHIEKFDKSNIARYAPDAMKHLTFCSKARASHQLNPIASRLANSFSSTSADRDIEFVICGNCRVSFYESGTKKPALIDFTTIYMDSVIDFVSLDPDNIELANSCAEILLKN